MDTVSCSLTVLFEDPFWVGVYERVDSGRYEASRIVFGAEPKDYQVYAWLLKNGHRLRFSPALTGERVVSRPVNPKRAQREIARAMAGTGVSTKAQAALQLEREQNKLERRYAAASRTRKSSGSAMKCAARSIVKSTGDIRR